MVYDVKFDYAKLIGRIKEYGFTQEQLAAKTRMSKSTLSFKLNNKAFFTQKEIRIICDLLEIEIAEIGLYFFTLRVQKN
jgi:transcriptional regulator with XRE-family HTH domain